MTTQPQHVSQEQREEGSANARAHDWDVSHGAWMDRPIDRVTMVVPAVSKLAANILGGSLLGGGYAIGKACEVLGMGKTVDNAAFRGGFSAWMWSNGIFPTVQYEPLRDSGAAFAESIGTAEPSVEDITQTPIIISNHTSYLDGVILANVLGCPRIVAMAGTREVPVVGRIMEDMDTVFVDRSSSNSRHATLDAIAGHCSSWKPGQRPLLIFPEGTTTNGESLLAFKNGAFSTGMPVRPVVLVYTGQWDPASTTYRETASGAGLAEISDREWATQFLGHFVHSLHVRVLAPYVPSAAEQADPELYARNCHAHVAQSLQRVRAEVQARSWKQSAGRREGSLGYQFGDLTRTSIRLARHAVERRLTSHSVQGGSRANRELLLCC
mmetsp:Transcript_52726/g.112809  ORF Transcript_52726/g.112809 Transcript_52726/m.112809 type:complete len:382 (+) Transcript_52726:116-1261(+)